MKTLFRFLPSASRSASTSAILLAATVLGTGFWVATSSTALAADCVLCHKRTTQITVVCSSLDYRRHVDHGDTTGMCPASRSETESRF